MGIRANELSTTRPSSLSGFSREIVLVGGGKMGLALLSNWIEAGLPPRLVDIVDPFPSEALQAFASKHAIALTVDPPAIHSRLVILALKPQTFATSAARLGTVGHSGSVIISIMAGVQLARLRAAFPNSASVLRSMPNLPTAIGCGATVTVSEAGTASADEDAAIALFAASGLSERVTDEELLDAVTAVSGSGPGYLFYLVECLAAAARQAGLSEDLAMRLARRTVEGAGALLLSSPKDAATLRQEVTSPGGTTAAGLSVLADEDSLCTLLDRTVNAAIARARELR